MKSGIKTLAVALGAALTFGIAGQASADVYGLGKLDISNLTINIDAFGGAGAYTFNTDANARLNGVVDGTDGSAECDGDFGAGTTNCAAGPPVLSGLVQNAPGGTLMRAEEDFTAFGQTGEYSNAEAAILTAQLVNLTPTSASSISESNLQTGTTASASTTVASNTQLTLQFEIQGEGSFEISFAAFLDRMAAITGSDSGIAQADTTLTVQLTRTSDGATMASWAPTGTENVSTCGSGLTCTATETELSINGSSSTAGGTNQVTGSGDFSLLVEGLSNGSYTLALATKTSTSLRRRAEVPIPGTLLLLGTALLLVGRSSRRNK